jgi:hypothetical protein
MIKCKAFLPLAVLLSVLGIGLTNATPTAAKAVLPAAKVAGCCPDCPDCCSWDCCSDGCCESCPDCCSEGCCPPGCCTGAKATVQAKKVKAAGEKVVANCCDACCHK